MVVAVAAQPNDQFSTGNTGRCLELGAASGENDAAPDGPVCFIRIPAEISIVVFTVSYLVRSGSFFFKRVYTVLSGTHCFSRTGTVLRS